MAFSDLFIRPCASLANVRHVAQSFDLSCVLLGMAIAHYIFLLVVNNYHGVKRNDSEFSLMNVLSELILIELVSFFRGLISYLFTFNSW